MGQATVQDSGTGVLQCRTEADLDSEKRWEVASQAPAVILWPLLNLGKERDASRKSFDFLPRSAFQLSKGLEVGWGRPMLHVSERPCGILIFTPLERKDLNSVPAALPLGAARPPSQDAHREL